MATAGYKKRQSNQAAVGTSSAPSIASIAASGPSKAQEARSDKAGRILAAALDLFERRHFANVSTKEIAAAAGLNSALLYYYYESKDALFRSVVEMAIGRVLEQFDVVRRTASGPRDVISGWLKTHIDQFDIIRKFVKISVDYSSSEARSPETDAAIAHFYDSEHTALTTALRSAIAEGICNDVDPDEIATFISTFLDGVMVRSVLFPNFDVKSEISYLETFIFKQLGWSPID